MPIKGKGLLHLLYQIADSVFSNDFWSGLTCQHQHFLTIAIDMQLTGADYGCQFWIILHRYPKGMIDAILFKQFPLQVRAHVGGVDGHINSSLSCDSPCVSVARRLQRGRAGAGRKRRHRKQPWCLARYAGASGHYRHGRHIRQ